MAEESLTGSRLLLTAAEAARALAVSPRSLWAMSQPRGPLRCVRVGAKKRGIRYDVRELERWVDGQRKAQG